jgi:hypothetical protein
LTLFVVLDSMPLGKGAFGIFSTLERARVFMDQVRESTGHRCEIKESVLKGKYKVRHSAFAAHTYDSLYDVYVFDEVYGEAEHACEAAGYKGLIVEFEIDCPDNKRVTVNE